MDKIKQEKVDTKKRKVETQHEGEGADEGKATTTNAASVKWNDDGEPYFELAPMRRLCLRKFKGKLLVDIREYYGDEDKPKPGKKGISLSVEQFKTLSDLIKSEAVDSELRKMEGT